ncbi:MAG: hypothetical protein ACM3W8_02810 [Sideroxydans sp.]|nr:hypothetical protein [Sideroxyarcus sp.]
MSQDSQQQILETLREIRDGQREMLALMNAQKALAEEQLQKSQQRVEESLGLQRLALQRQKSVTRLAIPAILACIAAIVYLVVRYL